MKFRTAILVIALAALTATTSFAASIKNARPTKAVAGKPKMPAYPR